MEPQRQIENGFHSTEESSFSLEVTETKQQSTKQISKLTLLSECEVSNITNTIYTLDAHDQEKKDLAVGPLFRVTENIIMGSTNFIESTVIKCSGDYQDEKALDGDEYNFTDVPLCLLKSIGCKMSCGSGDQDALKKRTNEILTKLSGYSWEAKAVMALAAFALEYGEFSLLAGLYKRTDGKSQLAKSIAIFKRVSVLFKSSTALPETEIKKLNDLVKNTLEMVACIHKIYSLSDLHFYEHITSLKGLRDVVQVTVYRSIVVMVACATKLNQLLTINDMNEPGDLTSQISTEIIVINQTLSTKLNTCEIEKDEAVAYFNLKKCIRHETNGQVVRVISIMKLWENVQFPKETVDITVLKEKHVVLFFTSLDISVKEIEVLKPLCDNENCEVVWVPIVAEWNQDLETQHRTKFEKLTTSSKVSCYTVQYSSTKESLKYIEDDWKCSKVLPGNHKCVLLTPKGELNQTTTAHLLISSYKANKLLIRCPDAGPTTVVEKEWMTSILVEIKYRQDVDWKAKYDQQKYIFFYGGRDNAWIQGFNQTAIAFKEEAAKLNISIESFCVGRNENGREETKTVEAFWGKVETLFYDSFHNKVNHETKEVRKLFSCKYEHGWAVLCKGSTVVAAGHGYTIHKVLEDFDTEWKTSSTDHQTFGSCFSDHHKKVAIKKTVKYSCHFDISSQVMAEETIPCPICDVPVNRSVIYRYCCTSCTSSTPLLLSG